MAASRLDGLVSELSLQRNHHYSTNIIVVMKPQPLYYMSSLGQGREKVNSKIPKELLYNYKILLAGCACI